MHRSRFLPALIVGLMAVLAACADTTSSTSTEPSQAESAAVSQAESAAASESASASDAAGETETVRLSQFAFDPEELSIAAGTEVTFVNADSASHTVTEGTDGVAVEDPIINEELAQNGSTSFTFDEPGMYHITCLIHPSMSLTITVEG